MTRPSTSASLFWVAFAVFIDMAGVGLIIPIMPSLIAQVIDVTIGRAAVIGGELLLSYALMQFLCGPMVGALSDRFGRRPIILGTLAVLGIDYAVMAWAPTLGWLFAGRLVSGVMGATWAAANSCIADLFPPEERSQKFGVLGAAGTLGFVIGPTIGGLLGTIDVRLPFLVAAIVALGSAAIGFFIFHETLPAGRRRPISLARANPIGTLLHVGKTSHVGPMLLAVLLVQLATQAQLSTWAYFLTAKLGWTEFLIGLSVAIFGASRVVAQIGLTRPLTRHLGERRGALLGLASGLLSYLVLASAASGSAVYTGIAIGAVSGIVFPALQSMMSAEIEPSGQGELQGAIASVAGIAGIAGPILMTRVFEHFAARGFAGAPFVGAAVLIALAMLLLSGRHRSRAASPGALS